MANHDHITHKFTTPKGVASYPHLIEPDTKFNPLGDYKVSVILDPEEDGVAEFIENLESFFDKAVEHEKANVPKGKRFKEADKPFRPELDDDGNETGKVIISAKMKARVEMKSGKSFTQKPAIVDAKGKKFQPKNLWSGSVLRVGMEAMSFWTAQVGAGISLRLKAVQVIELVEGNDGANGFEFGEEDGFEAGDEYTAEADTTTDTTDDGDAEDEDFDY